MALSKQHHHSQKSQASVFKQLTYRWEQCKRVFYAFLPNALQANDAWAKDVLIAAEYDLYQKMDVRDRHHACKVAERLLEHFPNSSDELLRAAFLHDIGKTQVRYNPWERIFVHLYTPKSIPLEPKETGLKGSWQRHLHHATYGAALIRAATFGEDGSERVAEIVAGHHNPKDDVEATHLKLIDEMF